MVFSGFKPGQSFSEISQQFDPDSYRDNLNKYLPI